MPFTFSHPALIIPFKRIPAKYVSMTGLVVGSVAPNFEKFIKLSSGNIYSHTFWGIFWFNLPLALALAFIFHLVVRNPLINNLPAFFRKRLLQYTSFNWTSRFRQNPAVVASSIVFSTFLHIVLDSFTHEGASNTYLFPILLEFITVSPFGFKEPISMMWVAVIGHALSLAGLLYIFYTFVLLPTQPVQAKDGVTLLKFWVLVFTVALAIIGIKFLIGGVVVSKWQLIYISIGAGLMSIFFTSAFWLKAKLS